MILSIEIPDAKLAEIKAILLEQYPEYSDYSNAQLKTAEEDHLLTYYKGRIRGLNREKLIKDNQSTADAEVDVIFS